MIKHVLNYFSVTIFSVILGIVAIPILTHLLEPEEYGLYNTFMAFFAIANVVMTLNFHTSIGRYWYEKNTNVATFITTSIIGALALLYLSSWILYTNDFLKNLLGLNHSMVKYLVVLITIDIFVVVYIQILAPQRESKKLAYLSISKIYLTFILGIILIYLLPIEKFLSLIFAQITIGILFLIYIVSKIKNYFVFHFNKNQLRYIVSYSGPLFFYSLSAIIMAQIDRIMISKMITPSDTGMYSFAFSIVNFLTLATSAILAAWTPDFFEDMESGSYKKINDGIQQIISLSLIVAIFVILFGNYIGYVLSSQSYHHALQYIPSLTLGMYFLFGYQLYARAINYSKKTVYLAITFLVAGGINIFLNYELLPIYGVTGAAIATLFANVILMIGGFFVNKYILNYDDYVMLPFAKAVTIIILVIFIKFFFYDIAYIDFFLAAVSFLAISLYIAFPYRKIFTTILQQKSQNDNNEKNY